MKIKIYQKIWHDISFFELNIKLSVFKKPNNEFYNSFYNKFVSKFSTYDDLNYIWKKKKIEVASLLEKIILKDASALSYGCGIGFVENILYKNRKDINLHCFDFSELINNWAKKNNKDIFFTSDNRKLKRYDFIYMVELLYAYDDREIISFLSNIKRLLNKNGKIIIINNLNFSDYKSSISSKIFIENFYINKFKEIIKPYYYLFTGRKDIQFWGYDRNQSYFIKLFEKAGLKNYQSLMHNNLSIQLFEKDL